MIIERLDLKAVGKFTDVSLDLSAGPRRFHLVYGPNESGKSTSLRAVSYFLFGFPHQADDNYLHTSTQMRVGGVLVDQSGQRLQCIRRRGRKGTLRDAEDSETIEESAISQMLGGIDRETFQSRFGLSHDELVRGGGQILSGEGDLGQILFSAGAGVSQLREMQDKLDEAVGKLFAPRGSKPSINASLHQLDEQRKELRKAQLAPAEYSERCTRLDSKRKESKRLHQSVQECVVQLAHLRACETAIPLAPQWRSTQEAVSGLVDVPMLDEAFTERRRQAVSDREVAISRQKELETRLAELSARLEQLPPDAVIMNHEAEIQALFQQIATHEKAALDKQNLQRLAKNNDRKIVELLRELSITIDQADSEVESDAIDEALESVRVSESLRAEIRELASQQARLVAQRNDASDTIETTKRRLADATQELDGVAIPGDPAVLSAAIDAVGNPQTMIEGVAEQQASCEGLRRRCDSLLGRLEGFGGTFRQAVDLRPPAESDIERLTSQFRSADQKVVSAEERTEQLCLERDELTRQIQTEQSNDPLPTVDQLNEAREQRDRATDRVADLSRQGADTSEAIDALRESIRLTDKLVDTIRLHHEQVHRRELLANREVTIKLQIVESESAVEAAKNEIKIVQSQWQALWNACNVAAGPPARMQRWLADREQLCEFAARLVEEEKRLEQSQSRLGRAAKRLGKTLRTTEAKQTVVAGSTMQAGLFDEPDEQDFVSLYDEAVLLRGQWTQARAEHAELVRRRDELAEELPEAETRFENCQKQVEQWHQNWRRATESFAKSDRATTREVLQMLDQIQKLEHRAKDRNIHSGRIESIDRDKAVFAARVNRVASNATESFGEEVSVEAIAQSIYQRLQAERAAMRSRASLREQLESTKQRLSEVASQRTACEKVLEQLCVEARCEKVEELPEIEQSARSRSGLQSELRDLENQLALLAGDSPLNDFIEAASTMQPPLLRIEIDQKEAELRDLRESVVATEQEIGALQHELNQMDGSGRASELMQSIQLVAGKISRDAEEYARGKIASLILKKSIDHYRKENQSPVLAHAERFFSVLTCGEYDRLKVDYDAKGNSILFGCRADALPDVPAHAMSTGTADALYLALRLASLQHQISHGKAIPLIIDDCLIQLDDRRAAAALKALSELSEQTQVILFTHHRHLLSLAEQNLGDQDYHVHQLGT